MTIEEIFNETDLNKLIQKLQSQRRTSDEDIASAKKALDPNLHAVTDPSIRKRKEVKEVVKDDEGNEKSSTTFREVNRTPFSYQADIVDKRVSFMLGNPLQVTTSSQHEHSKEVLNAIIAINKDVKIDSLNRQIVRTQLSFKEVAEFWFIRPDDDTTRYGFRSDSKIRCMVFRPDEGDVLYPLYDNYGDLIAFSRGFVIKNDKGKNIKHFETFTKKGYYHFVNDSMGWEVVNDIFATQMNTYVQSLGAIPIVYGWQKQTEFYKVQRLCDRNDTLASNHGDINDRHAAPILAAKGKVVNKLHDFIEMEEGSEIEWKSWNNATDSVESEFNRNEDKIYALTRTPKASMEQIKGMGSTISGEGLKMLFMDQHLEVMNKMEDFDIYFTRRYNIIKKILAILNDKWKKSMPDIEIDIKVIPYMTGEDKERIQSLVDLYMNNMISLETACKLNPYFEDAVTEHKRILKEKAMQETSSAELDKIINEDSDDDPES